MQFCMNMDSNVSDQSGLDMDMQDDNVGVVSSEEELQNPLILQDFGSMVSQRLSVGTSDGSAIGMQESSNRQCSPSSNVLALGLSTERRQGGSNARAFPWVGTHAPGILIDSVKQESAQTHQLPNPVSMRMDQSVLGTRTQQNLVEDKELNRDTKFSTG